MIVNAAILKTIAIRRVPKEAGDLSAFPGRFAGTVMVFCS